MFTLCAMGIVQIVICNVHRSTRQRALNLLQNQFKHLELNAQHFIMKLIKQIMKYINFFPLITLVLFRILNIYIFSFGK